MMRIVKEGKGHGWLMADFDSILLGSTVGDTGLHSVIGSYDFDSWQCQSVHNGCSDDWGNQRMRREIGIPEQ